MTRRRLTHDSFPPPPDHAHGPAECIDCRRIITMHTSGLCHWCGEWVTETTADQIRPGDVMYDFIDWATVTAVAVDGDRRLISLDGLVKPVRIGAGSMVWAATKTAVAA